MFCCVIFDTRIISGCKVEQPLRCRRYGNVLFDCIRPTGIRMLRARSYDLAAEAFDVEDGTELTIMQLLLATTDLTDLPDGISGFAHIYDTNGDGQIDSLEAALRAMANEVYTSINEDGNS